MEARDPNQDAGSDRMKSPTRAAVELFGIYIAMYLAVGAVIHVLSSFDALAAVAPDNSIAASAATTASTYESGADESAGSEGLGQTWKADECRPSATSTSD